MLRNFVMICMAITLWPETGLGYEPAQRAAIKNFAYKGVGFGASVEDLENELPVTFLDDQSTPEKGHRVYAHLPGQGDVSGVFFSFINDELYEIKLVYDAPTANRIGGWDTILERLVSKFGKADPESKGFEVEEPMIASLFWKYPDEERFIDFEVDQKYTRVAFTDLVRYRRWEESKKQGADVGF